ncbi:hypothetical protein IWX46DRAFT_645627 [Phyllosticta citricarpa]|uniref:Uncharacterized protein n=1 Tax=Phyllosticta citricarpa TaxID=55181 RepID=A0ABR1L405_9PEZI
MILPTTIIVAIAAVGVVALLLVLTALLCAGYTPTYCVSSVRKRLEAFRDRRQGDPEAFAAAAAHAVSPAAGAPPILSPAAVVPAAHGHTGLPVSGSQLTSPGLEPCVRLHVSADASSPRQGPVEAEVGETGYRVLVAGCVKLRETKAVVKVEGVEVSWKTVLRPDIIRARAFVAASQVSYMSMIAPRCNTLTSAGRLQVDVGKASNYDCAAGK